MGRRTLGARPQRRVSPVAASTPRVGRCVALENNEKGGLARQRRSNSSSERERVRREFLEGQAERVRAIRARQEAASTKARDRISKVAMQLSKVVDQGACGCERGMSEE